MTNRFVYIAKQSLPNGTHLKAKNVSSEQIRVLKNDKRICSRLTALTKKAKSVSSQANTSLRAVCMRGNYLSRRSRGLRITEAYTAGLLKNENYMRLGPPVILSVPDAVTS